MTDREMLELAAKAAGFRIDKSETNGGGRGNTGFDCMGSAVLDWHNGISWNPLRNDGDALRLAAKLKIDLAWQNVGPFPEPYVEAYHRVDGPIYCASEPEQDYRRAITRAAAAIQEAREARDA